MPSERSVPPWLSTELAEPTVEHVCGTVCGGSYVCPGCERVIPNCVGGADELGELCDACACHVWYVREDAEAEEGSFRDQ